MRHLSILLLLVLLLAACNGAPATLTVPATENLPPTEASMPLISPTAVENQASNSPTPSFTPTTEVAATVTAQPQPTPSAIPATPALQPPVEPLRRTPPADAPVIPTANPDTIPSSFTLPRWLGDSGSPVMMTLTAREDLVYLLTFLNALTFERYDLPLAVKNVRGFFWFADGTRFGLLSEDFATIYAVDLASGKVTRFPTTPAMLSLLDTKVGKPPPQPLFAFGISPERPGFLLLHLRDANRLSLDGRFFVKFDQQAGENAVTLNDISSGRSVFRTPNRDGWWDLEFALAPDGKRIAVLQGRSYNANLTNLGGQIVIYDLASADVLYQYEVEAWHIRWSPDSQQILYYTRPFSADGFPSRPCLLEPEVNLARCLEDMLDERLGNELAGVQWSPDGSSLFYVDYDNQTGAGYLCRYTLRTGPQECFTRYFPDLQAGKAVVDYRLAPEGSALAFIYDEVCPACNPSYGALSAVTDIQGLGYFVLGGETLVEKEVKAGEKQGKAPVEFPFGTLLWRPIPQR